MGQTSQGKYKDLICEGIQEPSAPVIGENGMTSNKHMNGYFLEQEALGGVGIPKLLCVLVLTFLKHYPFSKFKYLHSVGILKL